MRLMRQADDAVYLKLNKLQSLVCCLYTKIYNNSDAGYDVSKFCNALLYYLLRYYNIILKSYRLLLYFNLNVYTMMVKLHLHYTDAEGLPFKFTIFRGMYCAWGESVKKLFTDFLLLDYKKILKIQMLLFS